VLEAVQALLTKRASLAGGFAQSLRRAPRLPDTSPLSSAVPRPAAAPRPAQAQFTGTFHAPPGGGNAGGGAGGSGFGLGDLIGLVRHQSPQTYAAAAPFARPLLEAAGPTVGAPGLLLLGDALTGANNVGRAFGDTQGPSAPDDSGYASWRQGIAGEAIAPWYDSQGGRGHRPSFSEASAWAASPSGRARGGYTGLLPPTPAAAPATPAAPAAPAAPSLPPAYALPPSWRAEERTPHGTIRRDLPAPGPAPQLPPSAPLPSPFAPQAPPQTPAQAPAPTASAPAAPTTAAPAALPPQPGEAGFVGPQEPSESQQFAAALGLTPADVAALRSYHGVASDDVAVNLFERELRQLHRAQLGRAPTEAEFAAWAANPHNANVTRLRALARPATAAQGFFAPLAGQLLGYGGARGGAAAGAAGGGGTRTRVAAGLLGALGGQHLANAVPAWLGGPGEGANLPADLQAPPPASPVPGVPEAASTLLWNLGPQGAISQGFDALSFFGRDPQGGWGADRSRPSIGQQGAAVPYTPYNFNPRGAGQAMEARLAPMHEMFTQSGQTALNPRAPWALRASGAADAAGHLLQMGSTAVGQLPSTGAMFYNWGEEAVNSPMAAPGRARIMQFLTGGR
jgi:hypothetical protein